MLEMRILLNTATINAANVIRAAPSDLLGVNTAPWDGNLSSASTLSLVEAAGIDAVRLGGGSSVDSWHFNSTNQSQSIGQQADFIANLGATAIVDVDYGEASPQEAVAEWAYLDGNPNDTYNIGSGEQWNGSAWASVNWGTVGQWAALRAQTTVASYTLGANHPASFNFTYFEMGNEVYGNTWEPDKHGQGGDDLPMPPGDSPEPWDPTTLVSFSVQFQNEINAILNDGMESTAKPISIGIDSQAVDNSFNNWIVNILQQSAAQGLKLGFIADHYYTSVSPGSETDASLLGVSNTSAGGNTYDWSQRAAAYDNLIHEYLPGQNVQLFADEVNSVSSDPNKQSTSLVNGLFIADALGSVLYATGSNSLGGYEGFWVWDLHNGPSNNKNGSSLYGWRTYGDYGILGNSSPEALNETTPDYYALQLASKILQSGGTVVSASEDNETGVDTYAVLEPDGDLDLFVINKTNPNSGTPPHNLPDPTLTEQFDISGFIPSGQATIWEYGVAEDDAQATSTAAVPTTSLTNFTTNLTVSSGSFSYALPDYSMMVIDLKPEIGPTVAQAAAANPNPVTPFTTAAATALSVLGSENGSGSGLTYAWSYSGPSGVTYTGNTNGTNAAQNITANFTQTGTYTFTVTITDPQSLFTTSTIQVSVAAAFASQSGSSLNITLNSSGAVALSGSGGTITAAENGFQASFTGVSSIVVTDSGSGDTLNFNGGITLPISFTGASTSTLNVSSGSLNFAGAATISLGSLTIAPGALATVPNGLGYQAQLLLNNLSIAGTLDLSDNELLLSYGSSDPMSTIYSYLQSGFNNGGWNGPGIMSTAAQTQTKGFSYGLGFADGKDGIVSGLSSGVIEVKYTLVGDANLDGIVNGSDFSILANTFGLGYTNWDQGNFLFTPTVNGTEFSALSANFGQGVSLPAAIVIEAPVVIVSPTNSSSSNSSTVETSGILDPVRPVLKKKNHHKI
jgi:hypothetical protein